MAAEATALIGVATPGDQGAGSRVELDVWLIDRVIDQLEAGPPGIDTDPHVGRVRRSQADAEVLPRAGVVLAAATQQDSAEDTDSVFGQLGVGE